MNIIDRFRAAFRTGRRHDPPVEAEENPTGIRGVYPDDVDFLADEHIRRKWSDVRFYGPGAAKAEKRRAARLKTEPVEKTPATAETKEKPKRADLLSRIRKLKSEIEARRK